MWDANFQDELYHHGIRGQKWGVRRFQNEDGSYTSAGAKRYADAGEAASKAKAEKKAASREMWRDPTNANKVASYYTASARARQARLAKIKAGAEFGKEAATTIAKGTKSAIKSAADASEAVNKVRNSKLGKKAAEKNRINKTVGSSRTNKYINAKGAEKAGKRAKIAMVANAGATAASAIMAAKYAKYTVESIKQGNLLGVGLYALGTVGMTGLMTQSYSGFNAARAANKKYNG